MSRFRALVPSEHEEQKALVEWTQTAGYPYNRLFAIPNGGDRHRIVAAKLKAEGVRAAEPDLFLPFAVARRDNFNQDFHGLFIEMKRRNGYATVDQKQELAQLYLDGYAVAVCQGWEIARQALLFYVKHGIQLPETFKPVDAHMQKYRLGDYANDSINHPG